MADSARTSELLRRLIDLEPNDLEPAVALYGDCLEAFGRTSSGEPRIPEDMLPQFMRKFEDPRPFVERCAELVKATA